jgi:hypothetical protein
LLTEGLEKKTVVREVDHKLLGNEPFKQLGNNRQVGLYDLVSIWARSDLFSIGIKKAYFNVLTGLQQLC